VRPICSLGKSGWFSDRSGCYLAAGRPVVMEDNWALARPRPRRGVACSPMSDVEDSGAVPRSRPAGLCGRTLRAGPGSSRVSISTPTVCLRAS